MIARGSDQAILLLGANERSCLWMQCHICPNLITVLDCSWAEEVPLPSATHNQYCSRFPVPSIGRHFAAAACSSAARFQGWRAFWSRLDDVSLQKLFPSSHVHPICKVHPSASLVSLFSGRYRPHRLNLPLPEQRAFDLVSERIRPSFAA